jgi:hypothetical protein
MPRDAKPLVLPPPRYRIGDRVKFTYGSIPVVGVISEVRGPLGVNGERVYGIRYTLPDSEPTYGGDA